MTKGIKIFLIVFGIALLLFALTWLFSKQYQVSYCSQVEGVFKIGCLRDSPLEILFSGYSGMETLSEELEVKPGRQDIIFKSKEEWEK